jgi:glycosyltransferase involved in cell wall biosynthesis
MKKLLLLVNCIPEYRIPVYKELGKVYDFTVAHYGKEIEDEVNFKQIILHSKTRWGFVLFKENIYRIAQQYDAVMAMGDLHVFPYIALGFRRKRKFALIFWTGGVSFSYTKHYDENRRFDKLRFFIMDKADAIVFYCDYPMHRYVEDGKINKEKLFVAHNTVHVDEKIIIPDKKEYFLFVGTLYKEKKIFDLLEAYNFALSKNQNLQPLIIVGDGAERRNIELWIQHHELNGKIKLLGSMYDSSDLKEIHRKAIACISPGQAGLTVLSSMAYGVPFVTQKNAITGGEIFNIKNRENGILYDGTIVQLAEIIVKLSTNNDTSLTMAHNAQNHYFKFAQLSNMISGFYDAIQHGLKTK